jgi:alpha-tubulin suppressor-like RCC1 family protein
MAATGLSGLEAGSSGASGPALGSYAYAFGWSGTTGSFGTAFNTMWTIPTVTSIPNAPTIEQISTSGDTTLALTSSGQVYAWGDNSTGQLGQGETLSTTPPPNSATPELVTLPGSVTATKVAAGPTESYALGSDGVLYTWGDNSYGQLGQGYLGAPPSSPLNTPTYVTSPEAVIGLPASPITSIVTYEGTTMILDQDHVAYVWGAGTDDQIGNGASSNVATPTELSVLSGSTDELVAAIGEGQGFGIVATTSGDVYTWGSDAQGQLGNLNGPWNNSLGNPSVATPTQIPLPSGSGKAIAVAGGSYNGAALTDTGKIVT